jgi:hypothetical protein
MWFENILRQYKKKVLETHGDSEGQGGDNP